jgi:hypothetical protein
MELRQGEEEKISIRYTGVVRAAIWFVVEIVCDVLVAGASVLWLDGPWRHQKIL